MRYSKLLKLGAVGVALLLIPRRSSRRADKSNHMPIKSEAFSNSKKPLDPKNNGNKAPEDSDAPTV